MICINNCFIFIFLIINTTFNLIFTYKLTLSKYYQQPTQLSRPNIDESSYREILDSSNTLFIPYYNGDNFVYSTNSILTATYLSYDDIDITDDIPKYFLGNNLTNNFIAIDFSLLRKDQLPKKLKETDISIGVLRSFYDNLNCEDAMILGSVRGLCVWHNSLKYCSKCGSECVSNKFGSSRRCIKCNQTHYPRIEPAVIMLILSRCNNYCLLGRKHNWPKGRYSALAGFVEVGESIEQAVIRETFEESSVEVDYKSIVYQSSQPWPFPSSLMLGYIAEASLDGLPHINFDKEEMEDVKWFSKLQVLEGLAIDGSIALTDWIPNSQQQILHFPGKSSLAYSLICNWAEKK